MNEFNDIPMLSEEIRDLITMIEKERLEERVMMAYYRGQILGRPAIHRTYRYLRLLGWLSVGVSIGLTVLVLNYVILSMLLHLL